MKNIKHRLSSLLVLLILVVGGGINYVQQDHDAQPPKSAVEQQVRLDYTFRNNRSLQEHYDKHGIEMGFSDAASYEKAASAVVNNPKALHKVEKEDGDDVYYLEESNEFVIVSTDGYLRTYFEPDSGIKYFNKQ